jgi:hypothetical protein
MKGTIIVRLPDITDEDLATVKTYIKERVADIPGVVVETMTTG